MQSEYRRPPVFFFAAPPSHRVLTQVPSPFHRESQHICLSGQPRVDKLVNRAPLKLDGPGEVAVPAQRTVPLKRDTNSSRSCHFTSGRSYYLPLAMATINGAARLELPSVQGSGRRGRRFEDHEKVRRAADHVLAIQQSRAVLTHPRPRGGRRRRAGGGGGG